MSKTHGMFGTPTYTTWRSMKGRCLYPSYRYHERYKGLLCDRWRTFVNFFDDMGVRPEGMTLDRIDNEKGYTKDNCRWATAIEQNNNRRSNVVYCCRTAYQWARLVGVHPRTMTLRFRRWSFERAISEPANENKRVGRPLTPTTTSNR